MQLNRLKLIFETCSALLVLSLLGACATRQKALTTPLAEYVLKRNLIAQADGAARLQQYLECSKLYENAARLGSGLDSEEAYSASCCHAMVSNKDEAFGHLQKAVALGLHDRLLLIEDSDLTALHVDPRWNEIAAKVEANEREYLKTVNTELVQLFQQDQSDRGGPIQNIDGEKVASNDEKRRERVQQIYKDGGVKAADDYYHAAMVMQHGPEVSDSLLANQLALKAVELGSTIKYARWLVTASKDRGLMYQGKPQLYGTQFRCVESENTCLYQVDPSVTDEERMKWNVPPLAQAKVRGIKMKADENTP
jgi:hypothetical protein